MQDLARPNGALARLLRCLDGLQLEVIAQVESKSAQPAGDEHFTPCQPVAQTLG